MTEPIGPRSPHTWRKDELVPVGYERVDVDEPPDVLLEAFAQHLLVDEPALPHVVQVVRSARMAPADVERKLYDSLCLLDSGVVKVGRYGDWPGQMRRNRELI